MHKRVLLSQNSCLLTSFSRFYLHLVRKHGKLHEEGSQWFKTVPQRHAHLCLRSKGQEVVLEEQN